MPEAQRKQFYSGLREGDLPWPGWSPDPAAWAANLGLTDMAKCSGVAVLASGISVSPWSSSTLDTVERLRMAGHVQGCVPAELVPFTSQPFQQQAGHLWREESQPGQLGGWSGWPVAPDGTWAQPRPRASGKLQQQES